MKNFLVENICEWTKFKASCFFTTKEDYLLLCGPHRNLGKFMMVLAIHRPRVEVGTGTGLPWSPKLECATRKISQGNTHNPVPAQPQAMSYPEAPAGPAGPDRDIAVYVG